MKTMLLIVCAAMVLSACGSVTIRTDHQSESSKPPHYQKSYNYWWWGLKGEYDINVREICAGKAVEQMQSVASFSDAALTLLTIGIYAPRSARVWCEGAHDV
jgi:Bor protein